MTSQLSDRPPPPPDPTALPAEPVVNILMVDDESRNLDVLESFLRAPDYNLVRALTADEALLLLLEGEFACIVLDIQMPGTSGIELASMIKNRRRTQHIPIIFLTAYFQEDKDVLQGYSTGAVDYLTKPVNPQILKSKIEVFVDLFRKTRALEREVGQRQEAEAALQLANDALEARVAARTADLNQAIIDLRAREAALQVSEAQAKAASRAKDEFLAALSHELRTPLNPVLLVATEAANNPHLPAEVQADFEMIAKNVALEARLIDDMLDLTRIVHGKLKLEMRPFDVHLGLEHAISLAQAEIDRKRIQLSLELKAPRSIVLGDEVRLEQAFWNVINNAAKFTPEAGRIAIETTLRDDAHQLEVRITDTGIGMTPEELARIFGAFAQGDHSSQPRSHRFGGLGLGLVISEAMIKRHDGRIEASSRGRNLGTTFLIVLPLLPTEGMAQPPAGQGGRAAASDESAKRSRMRRILLVEDHEPTSEALSLLLGRRNYEVVAAPCLADARAALQAGRFDILISDLGLPDGDACELMRELGAQCGLVGIAVSGYGMEDDLLRTKAAGFISHLTKPVNVAALDEALSLALRDDA